MRRRIAVALAAVLLVAVAGCERDDLIGSPGSGEIISGDEVTVTGTLPESLEPGGTLTVNGEEFDVPSDRAWTATVPHADSGYVTPIEVAYVTPDGTEWTQRQSVVRGESIARGDHSPEGVGMRFTNEGLDGLGPVIENLAGDAFDISDLLLGQNPIIDQEDAFAHFDIEGSAYEAGVGDISLVPESTDGGIDTAITINDLYVGLDLTIRDGAAIEADCALEIQIPSTTVDTTFDFEPQADGGGVDVNMIGDPAVDTGQVDYEFISGICDGDTFVIGDIVNDVAGPEIEGMVGDAFGSNLGDPDGAGPEDSPIAGAIETALADISIAGPVGEAVEAELDAPFTGIDETAGGIDFRADASFTSTPGTGPGECDAPENAPALPSTFDVPSEYPQLGATTPAGDPYGLGLVISASAFNQMLGAMTECGVLTQEVTEFPGGDGPQPITAGLLSLLIPEFGDLPADTELTVRVNPTAAPFLTESPGPNGEPAELMLANLSLEFVQEDVAEEDVDEIEWLELAVDAPLGFSLDYDDEAGELVPSITPPSGEDISARVVSNSVGADEPAVEEVFPNIFPTFVDAVGSSFSSFPLPEFLGLQIDVLDVARDGNAFVLYADLNQVPMTRIENMQFTDASTGDFVTDAVTDVDEWRHRARPSASSDSVDVTYQGMLGADACCTTGDRTASAHAGYQMSFDVVPENSETWQVDIGHEILGAHTLIDEKVALEDAGGETRFDTPIQARVRVGDGGWQNFDAAVSPTGVVHAIDGGEGDTLAEFSGGNSLVLTGSTAETITVEVGFDLWVKSDSNFAFPAAGGDEVGIRFGVNDTITNGFTAGGYPGMGGRDIASDGHFLTVDLTTTD